MRRIDLETWPRRDHFKVYSTWDYPHLSLCANVDLTEFHPVVKQRGISFTVAIVYVLARAANATTEFRYRIRPDAVVEHDIVHPATTILTKEDLFGFCTFEYATDFSLFAPRAAEQIAHVREHPTLEREPEQDDLLYMTAIPWVSFTSFMHPLQLHPGDSVPRFAWGEFLEEGESLKMPQSVQGHHALMDGLHVGRFYSQVQEYLQRGETVLGDA